MGCHDKELSVLFTDDLEMAQLNKQYRGKDGSTNVLSFPMSEDSDSGIASDMMGDVVISIDWTGKESKETGETFEETLYRLLIHGVLHLLDIDHERSNEEAEYMEKEQIRLLSMIMEE